MANVSINHLDNGQVVDFTLDLKPWRGKVMDGNYIDSAIRNLIDDLETGEFGEFIYSICGDTLVLVSREENEYCVTVTKVVSRGYTKPA